MGQLKGLSIQGLEVEGLGGWVGEWWGISHSVLLRTDVILSSPSLARISWQPKKACAYPTVPTA